MTPLSNGNYVVSSPSWDNGAAMAVEAGAVTWGDGISGVSGAISALNSLVGSTAWDMIGSWGVTSGVISLSNGNYVVSSRYWDNGAVVDAGAVTWSFGASGIIGSITWDNSVLGATADGSVTMVFQYDTINNQLVVGRPADNIVTLFTTAEYHKLFLPFITG